MEEIDNSVLFYDHSLFPWDASVILSLFVCYHSHLFLNSNILELSAGTSALPSFFSAKLCNSNVVSCEKSDSFVLSLLQKNVSLFPSLNIAVRTFDWGTFPNLHDIQVWGKLNFVFAADIFYSNQCFDPILASISYILMNNENCKCYVSYVLRDEESSIQMLLKKWDLCAKEISLGFLSLELYLHFYSLQNISTQTIKERYFSLRSSSQVFEISMKKPVFNSYDI